MIVMSLPGYPGYNYRLKRLCSVSYSSLEYINIILVEIFIALFPLLFSPFPWTNLVLFTSGPDSETQNIWMSRAFFSSSLASSSSSCFSAFWPASTPPPRSGKFLSGGVLFFNSYLFTIFKAVATPVPTVYPIPSHLSFISLVSHSTSKYFWLREAGTPGTCRQCKIW